jgi:hypothetical protein
VYEYETFKLVEVILRKGRDKKVSNVRDEPNQGTLYAYMETSQQNPGTTIIN